MSKFLTSVRARFPMLSDGGLFWAFLFNAVILIILILYILFKIRPGLDVTVLRYNVLTGVEEKGRAIYVFQLPLLSLMVMAGNVFLASRFYRFEKFASIVLIASSAIVSAVFLMAAVASGFLL